jgi:ATP-dependent exoDNAse (exonuclease V) beta subunit
LRGALFAIDDETLLAYRHHHKGFHPFRVPDDLSPALRPVGQALQLLRGLHGGRNYRPVADTITQLLNATRAHVGFVLRPAGEQALANVLHVAELARQYEANGGMSFRGFVEELRDQAEGGQAAEAPILEEGSDGVRLMTVHKAKGLEFPVVILADITAKLRSERADRLIDRDRNVCYLRLGRWTPIELATHEEREIARDEAEGVRVAYVAATRARDLLVVPAVGDGAWEGGWTSPLNAAVYPPAASLRAGAPASGCPAFKKDSVWRRPDDEPSNSSTVCPGAHIVGGETSYPIVWWDPHALDLGVEPAVGIRRESLIAKDVAGSVVAEGLREYEQWRNARADAIAKGSIASVSVRTATEWAAENLAPGEPAAAGAASGPVGQRGLFDDDTTVPDKPEPPPSADSGQRDVEVVDARGRERPGGARFGELVHAMLAAAPLDAGADAIASIADVHGRILSAPDDEIAAAVETVRRVLDHQLLDRARAADARQACRRETPVTCLVADGTMIEGIVDLAFEENGTWTVVDYKSDRELATLGEDRYRRQVALYVSAIAQATAQPARGVLVRV